MSPIFNFHRKYPKALNDLARASERLDVAEDDIARSVLNSMREENRAEESEKKRSCAKGGPSKTGSQKGNKPS